MRLTKQLKAQATQIRFASQIVTNPNLMLDQQGTNFDFSTSDGLSKSGVSNDQDENLHPLVNPNSSGRWKRSNSTNHENNDEAQVMYTRMKRSPRKLPMVIMNNRSENGTTKDEQYQVSIERTSFDDHHEQLVL